MQIKVGTQHTVETAVTKENAASAVGSGYVDVFATPSLIAEMERAAGACIAGALEAGQTSVGTKIDVTHTAASPVGAKITTTATVIAADRREVVFSVSAKDEAGEIGFGTHTRFVVDTARFLEGAARRRVEGDKS